MVRRARCELTTRRLTDLKHRVATAGFCAVGWLFGANASNRVGAHMALELSSSSVHCDLRDMPYIITAAAAGQEFILATMILRAMPSIFPRRVRA